MRRNENVFVMYFFAVVSHLYYIYIHIYIATMYMQCVVYFNSQNTNLLLCS